MLYVKSIQSVRAQAQARRRGAAAAELAVCLPLICLILTGLWEVSRTTEVALVMWNSAREAARNASLGEDDLQTVATSLLNYLQAAEPTAFGKGHSTSLIAPVISLPADTSGYTCWDNDANRELFTMSFADLTHPEVVNPKDAQQLDVFQIGVSAPYASVCLSPLPQITGLNRIAVTVHWASMLDTPFGITPFLPAH